jgi:hypothetical protein
MKVDVLLGFKSGVEQRATFELKLPESKEGGEEIEPAEQRKRAFAKIVRMIMHREMRRGFINAGDFGFRIEDVSYMKLLS